LDEASLAAFHFTAASAAVDCTPLAPYVLGTCPDWGCSVGAMSVHAAGIGLEGLAEVRAVPLAVRAVRTPRGGDFSYLVPACCCKARQGEEEETETGAGASAGAGSGYG
jgi:hypothetical protein